MESGRVPPLVRAVVLGLGTLACTGPAPSLVRVAHESDLLSLDPAAHAESVTHSVLSNFYEPLVDFDADMALVPALAVTWSSVDDRTWVFDLRPGVRFHDGTPLDAEEVRRALERVRADAGASLSAHLANVTAIEADGPLRLRLRTRRRDPLLVNRLTYLLVARAGPAGLSGTGPYRLLRWQKGRSLEAEAFPGHWRGRPAIDRVEFVPAGDAPAAFRALGRGELDLVRDLPQQALAGVQTLPGVRVLRRGGLTTYYLWFHWQASPEAAPLADPRVRRAISLALDREALVRRLGGLAVPAGQLVQKGVFGHASDVPDLAPDPAAARRLLAEAGFPQGLDLDLAHRRDVPDIVEAAAAVRDALGEVGLRVRLSPRDWSGLFADWKAGRVPFFVAGWRFETGDAHSFLVDCVATGGPFNRSFSSKELDRLIETHGELFGDPARARSYSAIARETAAAMPLVPLFTRDDLYAASRRLRFAPRLDARLLVSEMALEGGS